jgi:2-oxoglutarate dehydrogenase E1 component
MKKKEQYLKDSTLIFSGNGLFIQELYKKFLHNPDSVSEKWQDFFKEVGDDLNSLDDDYKGASWQVNNSHILGAEIEKKLETKEKKDPSLSGNHLEYKIARLINRYRSYGHYQADLDPLKLTKPQIVNVLSHEFHDIKANDLNKKIALEYEPNFSNLSVQDISNKLNNIYCKKLAYEFEYISNIEEKSWLRDRIESKHKDITEITDTEKKEALNHLHRAASFEQLLHKKFPGAKRFSVEGGDVIIPALEKTIQLAGKSKIHNLELGMAHRGRLNVLTNICHKPYDQMIAEFKGASPIPAHYNATGDVKYHMGASSDRIINDHKLHISLAYNPSHLEAVNPVVIGKVRAKQDLLHDGNRTNNLAVLIHGDAAFMGQGSVAECLNMAYVDGNYIGGTLHFIINNQIGFTANFQDSRSTRYASDLAKFIECPIIHVNGEDVESVLFACNIAFEYRQKFGKDIIIDIICYRKYGHNEGDEPNYTQPIMYKAITAMQSLDEKYAASLANQGIIDGNFFAEMKAKRHKILEKAFKDADKYIAEKPHAFDDVWSGMTTKAKSTQKPAKTGIDQKKLTEVLNHLLSYPADFNIHPKIAKQYEVKKEIFKEGNYVDWALGESLAFASLLEEGYPVRITGQDAKRGTFSHRHSILRDIKTETEYCPLNNLIKGQKAKYKATDSVLSEYAALGFEYGYAMANPNSLTIWEAQFGDFSNGAQIIFDQFIASGEAKWLRLCGLVMLLPHGYEGQGPEHSSARLERYLQACAEDNIQVANITTPANFFHILRRQVHRDFRKPLIIMSPKSLLRHKLAISAISEMDKNTSFKPVITETVTIEKSKVKKLIFCTGKIYYDLYEARNKNNLSNIIITRIEELYPYPEAEILNELKNYKQAEIIWCQEEPENMGAWSFISRKLENSLAKAGISKKLEYVGREEAASPATGYMSVHVKEQGAIIAKALK